MDRVTIIATYYMLPTIYYMTRCPRCGKKPMMVTTRKLLRGHYNPTSRSRRYPNLQWTKINPEQAKALGASGKRIKLCTDCIKTLNKAAL